MEQLFNIYLLQLWHQIKLILPDTWFLDEVVILMSDFLCWFVCLSSKYLVYFNLKTMPGQPGQPVKPKHAKSNILGKYPIPEYK